jgi:hypothetical protein
MRKLLVPAVVAGLMVMPTVALAATPDTIARNGDLVDTGPLERPTLHRQAHSQLEAAMARAKRKATPPKPKPKPEPQAPAPAAAPTADVAVSPHLQAIAQCESGGDPGAIGGGGLYRGKYQFSYATWAAVGGSGDPAAAPEAEQDMRAAMLYERSGPGQWPVCGR